MKKTLMVLFCLSIGSTVFALPISSRTGLSIGKFYDSPSYNGNAFQFESGVRAGKYLLFSTGILLEYFKYIKLPAGTWIPEDRIVSQDKHQYAYGGSITLGIGHRMGPHLIYRFKRVHTYHETVIEEFINDSGNYRTITETRVEPAYDVIFGLHGKIPRTDLYLVCEITPWSRIWNVARNTITLGIGYEIGLGNIHKGLRR
ncbi:hypothetical protein HZA73_08290 [candidate division TA06 bacterium]|nr:hypothetical protein [candidate division TA06 bacterium]